MTTSQGFIWETYKDLRLFQPDWDEWQQRNTVYIWQGVALSLGINPEQVSPSSRGYFFSMSDKYRNSRLLSDMHQEFDHDSPKRCRIAADRADEFRENQWGGDQFPASHWPTEKTELSRFAAWAMEREWDVPSQFAELASGLPLKGGTDNAALRSSPYWLHLEQKAISAIAGYPEFVKSVRKVQQTGNLMDWLRDKIGTKPREAEIIKKVLSDVYPEGQ